MVFLSWLSKSQRIFLGIFVLLLVDVIWVGSSELTKFLFTKDNFQKPFFTTYFKTSLFILYLSGFIFYSPWRQLCRNGKHTQQGHEDEFGSLDSDRLLSEPIYIPTLKRESDSESISSQASSTTPLESRSVRFNNVAEVRHLTNEIAEDSALARLSYAAYLRADLKRSELRSQLPIKQVLKLAIVCCVLFFLANYCYQQALADTSPGIVNVMSSTSSLFTLILSAIFPSCSGDRFTLSKLCLVLAVIGGVVLISLEDIRLESSLPIGAIWSLVSAFLYACYMVLIKRRVDSESKMDLPMFLGFVGLFSAILLWPCFFLMNNTHFEAFLWPNRDQFFLLTINGLVGTVLSDLLLLWGCFLTSSLQATTALSLTIPLTMVADLLLHQAATASGYAWYFYAGCVPIFVSFFAISLVTHWDNWDPVLIALRRCIRCLCQHANITPIRLREQAVSDGQTQTLISDPR